MRLADVLPAVALVGVALLLVYFDEVVGPGLRGIRSAYARLLRRPR